MKILKKALLGVTVPFIILIAWWFVTANGLIPSSLLPTLQSVKSAFIEATQSGQLQSDLLISLKRVVQGFLMASSFRNIFRNSYGNV